MNIITSVQPPLGPIAPRFRKWLHVCLRGIIGWIYIHWLVRVKRIDVRHMDRLTELYRRFQDKRIRLIIAFRHPTVNDPQVMFFMLARYLRRAARRERRPFPRYAHDVFVYDRGVPLWFGPVGAFVLPGLDGVSIFRGKADPAAIRRIRQVLLKGDSPLAMAPEGASTYQTDVVGELNSGAALFGFWCAQDLARAGRDAEVLILPVSLKNYYRDPRRRWFFRLLEKLESDCLPAVLRPPEPPARTVAQTRARIKTVTERLIAEAEEFYARFFKGPPTAADGPRDLQSRMDIVTDAALRAAEDFFGLTAAGDFISRQHAAEQAAWNWIFRDDIPDSSRLSDHQRAMADRVAAEASLRLQHVQLADLLMYLRADYLEGSTSFERFVEALSNCDGLLARLKGGDISRHTPRPHAETEIIIGEPLSVNRRMNEYRSDRKETVAALMADLHAAYVRLTAEHRPSSSLE